MVQINSSISTPAQVSTNNTIHTAQTNSKHA